MQPLKQGDKVYVVAKDLREQGEVVRVWDAQQPEERSIYEVRIPSYYVRRANLEVEPTEDEEQARRAAERAAIREKAARFEAAMQKMEQAIATGTVNAATFGEFVAAAKAFLKRLNAAGLSSE